MNRQCPEHFREDLPKYDPNRPSGFPWIGFAVAIAAVAVVAWLISQGAWRG